MILARAYAQLSTTRSFGMGMGPIPINRVWEWEERNDVTDQVLCRFVEDVVAGVDASMMQRANRPPPINKETAPR